MILEKGKKSSHRRTDILLHLYHSGRKEKAFPQTYIQIGLFTAFWKKEKSVPTDIRSD
jgi:hypothetical protein